MTNDTVLPKRGVACYLLASIYVLIALMQVLAGVVMYKHHGAGDFLSNAGVDVRVRVIAPLVVAIVLHLAAACAVYLLRVEALAFLGYLLEKMLQSTIYLPFQATRAADIVIMSGLVFFTVRLFEKSPGLHAESGAVLRRPRTMLLIGLVAGQLVGLINTSPSYFTLVSTGSVSVAAMCSALIGCAALYIALSMMRSCPQRAKTVFLFAAMAMGVSLPGWPSRFGFAIPFRLGVPIALAGFALARRASVRSARLAAAMIDAPPGTAV